MMEPDTYFQTTPPPVNLDSISLQITAFISQNTARPIVLVTVLFLTQSGGTTVPLEKNTVRFLDNFSAGTRGSISAEVFISLGYAVIFLHRQYSLEPYTRHFHSKNCILDKLEMQNNTLVAMQDATLLDAWTQYQRVFEMTQVKQGNLMLKIDFVTVSDYLFLLRNVATRLKPLGARCMLYLAAAVSDFFIPHEQLVPKINKDTAQDPEWRWRVAPCA